MKDSAILTAIAVIVIFIALFFDATEILNRAKWKCTLQEQIGTQLPTQYECTQYSRKATHDANEQHQHSKE